LTLSLDREAIASHDAFASGTSSPFGFLPRKRERRQKLESGLTTLESSRVNTSDRSDRSAGRLLVFDFFTHLSAHVAAAHPCSTRTSAIISAGVGSAAARYDLDAARAGHVTA
jgi:hypothetical protein